MRWGQRRKEGDVEAALVLGGGLCVCLYAWYQGRQRRKKEDALMERLKERYRIPDTYDW